MLGVVLRKQGELGQWGMGAFAHRWSPLGSAEFHPARIGHASRQPLDDDIEPTALKGHDKAAWGRATIGSAAPGCQAPACRALSGRKYGARSSRAVGLGWKSERPVGPRGWDRGSPRSEFTPLPSAAYLWAHFGRGIDYTNSCLHETSCSLSWFSLLLRRSL